MLLLLSPRTLHYSSGNRTVSRPSNPDSWVPGALFSLSEELSDDGGNPELGPVIEDARAGITGGKGPNNWWAHAEYIENPVNK